MVENRNGLMAAAMATQADGHTERDAALLLLNERQKNSSQRITWVPTRQDFIAGARAPNVTAHVQKNGNGRRSNLDRRTTRHVGYARSLRRRWLVEKTFGWLKQTGPLTQIKLRGVAKSTGPSFQLRRPQPVAPATAHRKPDPAKPSAEVRLTTD